MHVVVEQSGYDLRNVGDIAMLSTCLQRIVQLAPGSTIDVVCHDQADLDRVSPTATALTFDTPIGRRLPTRRAKGADQIAKMIGPLRVGSRRWSLLGLGDIERSVRRADLVVASGGGFVTDTWWWHAVGVMAVLRAAQVNGTPTAMFGQGLGPLNQRVARRRCASVFPHLRALGLREAGLSTTLASQLGARGPHVQVTGDDALEIAAMPAPTVNAQRHCLGVNLRLAAYAGATDELGEAIGSTVRAALRRWDTQAVALPVSYNKGQVDADAIAAYFGGDASLDGSRSSTDPLDPANLRAAVAKCRAVVTGSYHAGVFALAQGVPAVCLVMSEYYRGKFNGLQSMFPETCWVVECKAGFEVRLQAALDAAWDADSTPRDAAVDRATEQVEASRALYAEVLA